VALRREGRHDDLVLENHPAASTITQGGTGLNPNTISSAQTDTAHAAMSSAATTMVFLRMEASRRP